MIHGHFKRGLPSDCMFVQPRRFAVHRFTYRLAINPLAICSDERNGFWSKCRWLYYLKRGRDSD